MRKLTRLVGKALGFIGLVLLTINIENLGNALGITNLASNPKSASGLINILRSPIAYALGLMFAGVGLAALVDLIAKRWDASHRSKGERLMELWPGLNDLCDDLKNELRQGHQQPTFEMQARVKAKYTSLKKLGMEHPNLSTEFGRDWYANTARFMSEIVPLLREGHPNDARLTAVKLAKEIDERDAPTRAKLEEELKQGYEASLRRGWA